MSNNTNRRRSTPTDLLVTTRLPAVTMREMVFGCDEPRKLSRRAVPSRPAGVRKFRLKISGLAEVRRLRGAIVCLVLGLGVVGCATAPRPVEVESVGQLAQGSSVWHAPTHADTDLSGGFQAVEGDDSATKTIVTVSAVEAPEVTTKTDGVTTGVAR